MIKLYDHPLSGNCYKVRLTLAHLSIEYEKIPVDIFQGEHHSDEFTELNPNRKIPVLCDGDLTLWESNAIVMYLGKKFSPNEIFPEDPGTFGLVSQWILFGKTTLDPNLAMARYMTKFLDPQDRNEQELNKFRVQGKAALTILDDYLAVNQFLAGNYSIADIACYPYVYLAQEGRIDITKFGAVNDWRERVSAQPGYVSMNH